MTRISMNSPLAALRSTRLASFSTDTDGAVTVDWVVLTAAIVGIGVAVLTSVSGGTTALAANVSNYLSGVEVASNGTESTSSAPVQNGLVTCDHHDYCTVFNRDTGEISQIPNTSGYYSGTTMPTASPRLGGSRKS
jgi:hypothetical protein